MNHPIRLTLLLVLACIGARAADLVIRVDKVRNDSGQVKVALFDSAAGFLKRPVRVADAPASAGATTVVIKDLAPGDYGFAVYHDANGNGAMDRNLVGIPLEPFGFSKDAQGRMGPPAFEAVKLAVPAAGLDTAVTLR